MVFTGPRVRPENPDRSLIPERQPDLQIWPFFCQKCLEGKILAKFAAKTQEMISVRGEGPPSPGFPNPSGLVEGPIPFPASAITSECIWQLRLPNGRCQLKMDSYFF